MTRMLLKFGLVRALRKTFPQSRFMASTTHVPQAKKQKVIGTHSGTFHCDEALAVFLLRRTATYRDSGKQEVKRTRDPAVLATCDIVVDVGAVYDETKNLFDHHQRGFTEVFGYGFETKLSSAGLIYKHFGKEVIANETQLLVEDPKVMTIWLKMYKEFIEAVDAIDNGISQYPSDIKPRYKSSTDLSSRVGSLNPAWNQSSTPEVRDAQFAKASQLTGEEFLNKLNYYANAWLPARGLLVASINASKLIDTSGKIIVLEQFLPWKEHLFDLEAEWETAESDRAIYVVYEDAGGNWHVQAVPVTSESFESRKALPEAWRGLRDDTLSTASGIEGCVFVHASGFIGGNKTKDGAMKLAKAGLEM
ncbi:GAMM1 protein [Mycena pura]|uniref:GAMM1 protein n=1 Tax=Mycena pura TaxID=153505 RepID=A0AAD6YP72_9AGAR|nr:GAMM1 protein [Mycena pura]